MEKLKIKLFKILLVFVSNNYKPEDVFTPYQLDSWAYENGYTLDIRY